MMSQVQSFMCSNCTTPEQGIQCSHCVNCGYDGGTFQCKLSAACRTDHPFLDRVVVNNLFIEMFDEDSLHSNIPFDIASLRFWLIVHTGRIDIVDTISNMYDQSFVHN